MLFLASYLSSAKIAHCDSHHGGLVPFGAFELPPQVNDALHLHLLWQPYGSMVGEKLSLQFRVLGWILSKQGKFQQRAREQPMFQGVPAAVFLPSRCSRTRGFLAFLRLAISLPTEVAFPGSGIDRPGALWFRSLTGRGLGYSDIAAVLNRSVFLLAAHTLCSQFRRVLKQKKVSPTRVISSPLTDCAEKDRNALLCQLNSYLGQKEGAA